jgi:hypothetical protein
MHIEECNGALDEESCSFQLFARAFCYLMIFFVDLCILLFWNLIEFVIFY